MRRGICVKCGAATVRAAKNGLAMGERPDQTFLRPNIGPDFRGMVRNQGTDLWAFGCTTCGYLELFVLEAGGLAFMEQSWAPVPPQQPATPPTSG